MLRSRGRGAGATARLAGHSLVGYTRLGRDYGVYGWPTLAWVYHRRMDPRPWLDDAPARDQRARRPVRPGRALRFDKPVYAHRNVIERCINRLKQWQGLATRYEKRAVHYRAMLVLAAIVLWLER